MKNTFITASKEARMASDLSDSPPESDVSLDELLNALEEHDGDPLPVVTDDTYCQTLAVWKRDVDLRFDQFEAAVNWRGVSLKKSRFHDHIDTVLQGNASTNEDVDPATLEADEFAETLDLDRMDDRELAYNVFQWVAKNGDILAIKEEDRSGGLLTYRDGIWVENGEQELGQITNQLLREKSGVNVTREVENQYLKVEPDTNVSTTELGLEPGYLAVENGLLDLYRGEIVRELRPKDYAITKVPWRYDPEATCPRWRRFIRESVENGKHEPLQEFIGYCLWRGEMPYAKALLLVGDGRNGKSTFLDTVQQLLGRDNVMSTSLNKLAGSRFSAYRLEDMLANINADIEGDQITDISMFKNMTGNDAFEVEQKYGDPRDLQPSAKLLFAANEVPDVDTDQDAFFRRWILVEFPHTFTESHRNDSNPDIDPELRETIQDEMEGILVWAIEGLQRLQSQGHFTNVRSAEEVRQRW